MSDEVRNTSLPLDVCQERRSLYCENANRVRSPGLVWFVMDGCHVIFAWSRYA